MVPVEVLTQVSERSHTVVAARSVRRATARRASARRASARRRQRDDEASIVNFLTDHRERTVGDLAKHLNLDPEDVASCLTQLAIAGEIRKGLHGYSTLDPDRPSGPWALASPLRSRSSA